MRRVRPPPERAQDQDPRSSERFPRVIRHGLDVGDVRDGPDAVTVHPGSPMLERQRQDIDIGDPGNPQGHQLLELEPRLGRAGVGYHRRVEDVAIPFAKECQRCRRAVQRQRLGAADRENPQVVDAVDVIGMFVGVEHRIEPGDPGGEELQAELGRRIDEQRRVARLEEGRAPGPAVARVARPADRAIAADHGHPERGSGAEQREPHPATQFRS